MEKKNSDLISLLTTVLVLVVSGNNAITDAQVAAIKRILMGTVLPGQFVDTPSEIRPVPPKGEFIYGLAGLASFIGTSIPTAARYRERFEPARVHFGGRKLVWDKAKLLELARENNEW